MRDNVKHSERTFVNHPIDDIEPVEQTDDYREIAKKFLQIIATLTQYIHDAKNRELAIWQVAYALGIEPLCAGKPMEEKARELGVTRQAVSKGATAICKRNGLPPSFYMKSEGARKSYKAAREKNLTATKQ